MSDKSAANKKSFYLPAEVLAGIEAEAKRQDRSMSWLVQQAWKIAQPTISQFPAVPNQETT